MISAIVAVDNNWGIGYNGDLLEHIPDDLKYFKTITEGHVIVMGRKTWDSLPKKPLPNRVNVVVSSKYTFEAKSGKGQPSLVLCDMPHCIQGITNSRDEEIFIIGGGEIYKQLLPYCDRVYVTLIEKSHDNVDTYFPNLDEAPEWEVSTRTELREYENVPYTFLTYDRIS